MPNKLVSVLVLIASIFFLNVKGGELDDYRSVIKNLDTLELIEGLSEFDSGTKCGESLNQYLSGLSQIKLWALQMLDANAKIPEGILFGNSKDLGNFDECIKVKHPEGLFVGQHCLLDVSLNLFPSTPGGNGGIDQLVRLMPDIKNYGLCLPSTCSAKQIETGLNLIFNVTSLSNITKVSLNPENCRTTEQKKLKDTDWAVVGVLIAFGVITIISTLYDVYQQFYAKNAKPHKLLASFSVYSNGKFLFQISENASQLKALHGIRVFSMSWVVLCHAYMTIAGGAPATNFLNMIGMLQDDNYVVIVNGFVSVDSFFFLSGLLVCVVFFRDMSKKGCYDVPLSYINRYIRLTPPYAIMMLIMGTVYYYIGDGPLWHSYTEPAAEVCRKSWWSGILYVQSFVDSNSNCVSQSWYLSTDMQLYWLSPLVLYVLYYFPTAAPFFLICLTIVVTLATFIIVYVNNLGVSLVVTTSILQMDREYVKFYSRATPYIIGIATGYILCGVQAKKIKIILSPLWVCVGWMAAAGLTLGCLYGITAFTDYQYTEVEAAFYLSFSRIMWSLGLAWITVACTTGYGGPINGFLSWNIFQPLGKLSYCVFLIHGSVQAYRIGSLRTSIYAGDIEITWWFLGDLFISFLLAIPLTLIFEIPFGNIGRYFLQNVAILPLPLGKKKNKKPETKSDDSNNNLSKIEEGHSDQAIVEDSEKSYLSKIEEGHSNEAFVEDSKS